MKFLLKLLKSLMTLTQNRTRTVTIPASKPKKGKPPVENILRLYLDREWFTESSTIGSLYVEDKFECYVLEDQDRLRKGKKKVYGVTAIPEGRYEVKITYSPKYKKQMPILVNVPGFTGIRIHPGNSAKDTEGCLLPGRTKGENWVGQSKLAYNALLKKLEKAKEEGKKIYVTIGL